MTSTLKSLYLGFASDETVTNDKTKKYETIPWTSTWFFYDVQKISDPLIKLVCG